VFPGKIVYLTKKSNSISQLQTTISFKMENFCFELHNKVFNESYVSLVFEKHNSIETKIMYVQPFPVNLDKNAN